MGDSTQNILVKVGADIAELSKGMREVQDKISGVGKSTEDAASRGGVSLGKLAGALGLVKIASAGIGMIKDSISSAFGRIDTMEQFERVMVTLTGSSEKAASVLDSVRDTVTGTAYGLDVAAKSTQDFVTSGMDVDKATAAVANWGDAVAFYGSGSNESFASVTDALAKMSAKGKVQMDTMNRLAENGVPAMQIYADATGQSVEQVAATMQKGGIKADEFMAVMDKAFVEGTASFGSIEGAAKEAGASWGASFDNMKAAVTRGVVAIIQGIDEMLASNGLPSMRDMIADFGKKFESVLLKVATAIPPFISKIQTVYNFLKPWIPLIKMLALGIGTFVLAFATMNTAVKAINAVKLAFTGLKAVMMATSGPWLLLIAAVVMLAYMIYKYWDEIKEYTAIAWAAISSAVVSAWQYIVDLAKSVWGGISSFFVGLWDGIVSAATGAWNGLVSFLSGIWNGIVSTVTSVFGSVAETMTTVWNNVSSAIMSVVSPIVEFLTTQFTTAKTGIMTIFGGLVEYFTGIWNVIKNVFLGALLLIFDLVTGNFTALKADAIAIFANILAGLAQAWNGIKTVFSGAMTMIKKLVTDNWNYMKTNIMNAMSAIKSAITTAWNSIKSAISNAMSAIKSGMINAWNAIKSSVTNTVNSLKSGISNAFNSIKSTITNIWNSVKSFLTSAAASMVASVISKFMSMIGAVRTAMSNVKSAITSGWNAAVAFLKGISLADIGRNIVAGLAKGITGAFHMVTGAIKGLAEKIPAGIRGVLGIKSPSRVTKKLGVFTGQGLVNGLKAMRAKVASASSQMANAARPDLDSMQLAGITPPVPGTGARYSVQSAHIDEVIDDRDKRDANQPIQVALQLGGRDYEAFVDDIDSASERKARLKRKMTRKE